MKYRSRTILAGLMIAGNIIRLYGQIAPVAQDTLKVSLADAWQRAEVHSRAVEIKKKAAGIAGEEVKDAQMERYPELSAMSSVEEATNIPVYEHGLFSSPTQHDAIHTLYRVGADFYFNLYNGNKLNLKIEAEKTLHQMSIIQKEQAVSDIRYQTAVLYLDLRKSLIFRDLIVRDIADQEKQLVEISAFHKNGIVLKSDVLRVQLELSKRKMTLVTIENDIQIVTQKLNIIIGNPDETVVIPEDIVPEQEAERSYDQYLEEAFRHSFPYHISEQQTNLSRIHLQQVKANIRPKVGIYGNFYFANPQIFLYPYNPYWYSLGVAGLTT